MPVPVRAGVILYQWLQGWVSGLPQFRTIVGSVRMIIINGRCDYSITKSNGCAVPWLALVKSLDFPQIFNLTRLAAFKRFSTRSSGAH